MATLSAHISDIIHHSLIYGPSCKKTSSSEQKYENNQDLCLDWIWVVIVIGLGNGVLESSAVAGGIFKA